MAESDSSTGAVKTTLLKTMDTHLVIDGDRVFFEGRWTPSNQLMIAAGGFWDENVGSYYIFIDQVDALGKLAQPFADTQMPITGKIVPGTFVTFDAIEGFVVRVDEQKNVASLIMVYRRER